MDEPIDGLEQKKPHQSDGKINHKLPEEEKKE